VRLLLDTHTFIWWSGDDPSLLSPTVKALIGDRHNDIFLSTVSVWEMAILIAKGRLAIAQSLRSLVVSHIALYQFQPLMITYDHAYYVETLPMHHKDPWDRLLIAQAFVEDLIILTRDHKFPQYGVQVAW
jgi:PIN domain nuclease of toxin-antitoxin system